MAERIAAEARRPFDLARGPLLRAGLWRLGETEHVLLLALHHIVSDGWSLGVLVREVTALYPAFAAGLPSPLPELPVQYADFAAWQRSWLAGDVLDGELRLLARSSRRGAAGSRAAEPTGRAPRCRASAARSALWRCRRALRGSHRPLPAARERPCS